MKITFLLTTFVVPLLSVAAPEIRKGLLPEVQLNSKNEDENTETAFKSEVLITKAENNAIESLKKIITKQEKAPHAADLYLRLAELYMRRAKSGRFFDLNDNAKGKLNLYGIPTLKATESLNAAIEVYNKIEKTYPQYKNLDTVYFNNALAHAQTKRLEVSKDLYQKLITNYPKSPFVADALLELGEIFYNQQNFTTALEKFQMIENFKQSKAYPYGLYKSAWSFYNLKQTDEGVQQLKKVIALNPSDSKDEKKYNLRKEALRDMTLFVGETTPPEQLYSFFKSLCTEQELGEVILNLAKLYESHSRHKEISIFADQFIKTHTDNPQTAQIYSKLIEAQETLKNRPQVIGNLKKLGEHCQNLSQDKQMSCKDEFRKISLDISKKWWDIWLKNKNHTEFSNLTTQSFEILLSQDDINNPDSLSRYAYAELLFQLNKYELSYENYLKVSLDKKLNKDKTHDALYGALYSLEKLSETHPETNDKLIGTQKSLAERYLKDFPTGEHTENLKFKLGFIAYKNKEYDKSLAILEPFSTSSKKVDLKNKAQDIILDIYNLNKDYKKIMNFSQNAEKSTNDDKRKKYFTQLNEEAHYSQMQLDTKDLTVAQKIIKLKEFALSHKQSKLGQDAFWQAISLSFANDLDILGSDLSIEFVQNYPKDLRTVDALKDAVKSYIDAGLLKKAISTVKTLTKIDTQKALLHEETLCDLLKANSELSEARVCYKKVMTLSSDKNKKQTVLSKMFDSYEKNQNNSDLNFVESEILKDNIEPYATQILINRARKLIESGKNTEAFAATLKINSRPVDTDTRAEARLLQAVILEKEFISQSVKAREDKFSMVLAIKTEKFDKAFTAYSSTVKMSKNEDIQLNALKGIDRLYQHFIETLTTMPVPQTLSSAEQTALKNELLNITVPFGEKRKDNLNKLRMISKLSATESEEIIWSNYSLEKSIEPRLIYPSSQKMTHYLPLNLDKGLQRLPASIKKCNLSGSLDAQNIGGCLQNKKFIEAEALASKMTESKQTRPMGLYYLSVIADSKNELDKAFWMIEKALASDKTNPYFNFQKGKLIYSVKDLNRSLPYFEKALVIKRNSREMTLMSALKAFSDRDFANAKADFSQLAIEDVYTFNVANLYVESVLQTGDIEQATQLAQKFSSQQPLNTELYLEMARLHEEFSLKKDEAIKAYQKALVVSNNSEQKEWLKKKIEFLQTNKHSQISSNVGG